MKIGLNGRYLGPDKNGVARYLFSLLEQWSLHAKHHTFYVYNPSIRLDVADEAIFQDHSHMILRTLPRPFFTHSFHLWYNWTLPRAIRDDGIDFFFSPDYFLPPLPKRLCTSMTIHDVSYLAHPEWFPLYYRAYCWLYSRRPAARTNCLLTVSEYSKQEILRYIPIPESRIRVTPEAVDPKFRPGSRDTDALSALGINKPYFLFVGKILNRRHLLETLQAFQIFLRLPGAPTFQFAIRGKNETSPRQDIESFVKSINQEFGEKTVVFLPYLEDAKLIKCYQGAHAFFYLSSYEGFGLPVLEALATGTPTVTMSTTSIPEVAGDAAFYVDPKDASGIAQLMYRLATDNMFRSQSTEKSLVQARRFSWENTARDTLAIIEETYAESR